MSSTAPARLLVIALTSLLLGPLAHSAESNDYQAEQATEPLALLLSIANDEVPRSTCRDPHGAPSLKLKDLLAPQLANLDQALGNVSRIQSNFGVQQQELESLKTTLSDLDIQYQSNLSELQDLDYNKAISDFIKQQINLEAAQKSFAQISGLSLFKYL